MGIAPAARPTHAVRLPLQIGTSSLWSLARGAGTLLPGLALVIGAIPLLAVAGIHVAAVAAVVGTLLVYFAGMHLFIAARLRGDGKRGENEDIAGDVPSPLKLHKGLAESAIREDGGASAPQSPSHDVLLELERIRVEVGNSRESGRRVVERLRL